MKKIVTLIMLLCMVCTGAWAQTTTSYPSTLKGNKIYTITSNTQGALTVRSGKTNLCGTEESSGNAKSTENHANHFAFIQKDGNYYLYSILTYKYVDLTTQQGTLVDTPTAPVKFKSEDSGTVMIYGDDDHIVNLGGSKQITIDQWGGPNYSTTAGRNKKDNGNSFTITEVESIPYLVVSNNANGGVKYNNTSYGDGTTFTISGDNYITEDVVSPREVSGYTATITFDGAKVNVTYEPVEQVTYTIENGQEKSVTEILEEEPNTYRIVVNAGGTLNLDQDLPLSQIQAAANSTLKISNTTTNIAAITGAVNVVINVENYSLTGNKHTNATGKLTIANGKKLTIGSGDSETNSVASFTTVLVDGGQIYHRNQKETLHDVTLKDGGSLYSYDMGVPGSNASSGTFTNSWVLEGTTTIIGECYILTNWNAQYDIKKLAGSGTLKLRGDAITDEDAAEMTYYAIRDVEDFTGALDILNKKAIFTNILENIKVTNGIKVNKGTFKNITLTGNERINTACADQTDNGTTYTGSLTIDGITGNDLTSSSSGYALVADNDNATKLNLKGNIDLTRKSNGENNTHNKMGYKTNSSITILENANVKCGGIWWSKDLENAPIEIQAEATLTATDKIYSSNITNAGHIKIEKDNLGTTTYIEAANITGDNFDVIYTEAALNNLAIGNYTVATCSTTNAATNVTVNGSNRFNIGNYLFTVAKSGNNIVLTKQHSIGYTITYRTGTGHSWTIEDATNANTELDINNFNTVEFYTDFNFENADLQVREDNHEFVITCTEDFPFTVGKLCRIQSKGDINGNKNIVAGTNSAYFGTTPSAQSDGENVANNALWIFEHVAGTPDQFTLKNFAKGTFMTAPAFSGSTINTVQRQDATEVGEGNCQTSQFKVIPNTNNNGADQNAFSLVHPNNSNLGLGTHSVIGNWNSGVGRVALWNGTPASNDQCCFVVLPIESFTTTLNGVSGDGYYGTIYSDLNIMVPTGATAYRAELNGESLHLEVAGNETEIIPAGAYILHKSDLGLTEGAKVTVAISMSDPTEASEENVLTGTLIEGKPFASEQPRYALSGKNGVIGFYKYNPATYPVAKAVYIPAESTQVAAFYFDFGDDPLTTAIQELQKENQEQGTIFDLQGRRIQKVQKGMNIINGRKVLR